MTIINAAWQPAILNLDMGDIFVTNEALVRIRYSNQTYTGSLGGIVGFLAKGAVGGVMASVMNYQAVGILKSESHVVREYDYGMTIEDRIRKRGGLVILRKDVQAVDIDPKNKIIRIVYQGGQLDIVVEKANDCQEKLQKWFSGKLENQEDSQGVNIGIPNVVRFLGDLNAGKELPSAMVMERILGNEKYLSMLLKNFDGLKKTEKIAVVNTLAKSSGRLKEIVQKHLQSKYKGARRYMIFSMLALLVGLTCLILSVPSWSRFDEPTTGLEGLELLLAMTLLGTIPLSIMGYFESKRYRKLFEYLK